MDYRSSLIRSLRDEREPEAGLCKAFHRRKFSQDNSRANMYDKTRLALARKLVKIRNRGGGEEGLKKTARYITRVVVIIKRIGKTSNPTSQQEEFDEATSVSIIVCRINFHFHFNYFN